MQQFNKFSFIRFNSLIWLNLLVFSLSQAETIKVPADHSTIRAAIFAATAGDTILVAAGVYPEHIHMRDGIFLFGTGGSISTPADTTDDSIIDGTLSGRTVTFFGNENATISGFTLKNGFAISIGEDFHRGGNIYARDSNVIIENNLIMNGRASSGPGIGGGVYFTNSSGIIRNNEIRDNSAWASGAGIALRKSNPIIAGNVISNNQSDWGAGIDCGSFSSPIIKNNIIDDNFADWKYGGGILVSGGSSAIIENNTLVNNRAGTNCCGSCAAISIKTASCAFVLNNIIVSNNAYVAVGGICCSKGSSVYLGFNNVFNNGKDYSGCDPDDNSISIDPFFVGFDNKDYRLQDSSLCIDAGNPASIYNDLDETRNDIGAYGGSFNFSLPDSMSLTVPLVSPFDGAIFLTDSVRFEWTQVENAHHYHFQLTTDPDFVSIDNSFVAEKNSVTIALADTNYYWRVRAANAYFFGSWSEQWTIISTVEQIPDKVPTEFFLAQNYPNPFNPETTIEFSVTRYELVTLQIYTLTGQLVRELVNERYRPGVYKALFDGRDGFGHLLPSGIYFYRLRSPSFTRTLKMVLVE